MTDGVDGLLREAARPSHIPPLEQAIIDRVIALTATEQPHQATHSTAAAMAKATGISVSSVQRIWRAHSSSRTGCAPGELYTGSRSGLLRRQAAGGVAGLYIDPPAHAVVLSVDERSADTKPSIGPNRACP